MTDLYRVPTCKTWRGFTPGRLLKAAYVCQMGADNYEIISDEFPGVIFERTERDELVLYDSDGILTALDLSARDYEKLVELCENRNRLEDKE